MFLSLQFQTLPVRAQPERGWVPKKSQIEYYLEQYCPIEHSAMMQMF